MHQGHHLSELPFLTVYCARERASRQDRDTALPVMRAAVDELFPGGQVLPSGVASTTVLVETLLDRGADDDVAEAEAAIDRLERSSADDFAGSHIMVLRLRALLARARGDEAAYRELVDRYRATSLGFEGHLGWAEAMT